MITWISGQSKSGKSTLARKIRTNEIMLDGDAMRATINKDLGFSKKDREENNLRIARLARELDGQGFNVIVATIAPYKELREQIRKITGCKFIYLEGGISATDYPYEAEI
jgi:adenylylsulfate kinase